MAGGGESTYQRVASVRDYDHLNVWENGGAKEAAHHTPVHPWDVQSLMNINIGLGSEKLAAPMCSLMFLIPQ